MKEGEKGGGRSLKVILNGPESSVNNCWISIVIEQYMLVSGNTKPFNIYHLVQGGPRIGWYDEPWLGGFSILRAKI